MKNEDEEGERKMEREREDDNCKEKDNCEERKITMKKGREGMT